MRERSPKTGSRRRSLSLGLGLFAAGLAAFCCPREVEAEVEQPARPVRVRMAPCAGVSAFEVRRIVAVELGGRSAATAETRLVTVRCNRGTAVIDVEGTAAGDGRQRRLDLAAEAEAARPRVLALAIVEAVESSSTAQEPQRTGDDDAPRARPGDESMPLTNNRDRLPPRLAATLAQLAVLAAAATAAAEESATLPNGRELTAPTPADMRGLDILEQERTRFEARSRGFATTLNTIVRREQRRRRTALVEAFDRRRSEQAARLGAARRNAIAEFEAFLREHPDDARYTPDAMFRLAELYYEDSYETYLDGSERYAELEERHDRGEAVELPAREPAKDFSRTIALFRRLIAEHPTYRHLDGALYLLGYCLNETGATEEARTAWLHLVCRNRFQYRGAIEPDGGDAEHHPAAELPRLRRASGGAAQAAAARYESGCVPVVESSRFLDEAWLRIGEYHFDFDYSPGGLDLAIAAYRNALTDRSGPFYDKALYKLAWSYYRADRYPEAIRHFAMLVEHADERRARTGRTGSETRPEAVQYLGIAFAENDWDNDATPDGVTTIERLQNAELLPQDRPFTAEVYFQTGHTLFDLGRFRESTAVLELALERWPTALGAPRACQRLPDAYAELNEPERAREALSCLFEYGRDSSYTDEHPEEAERVARLARNALRDYATSHHEEAQRLRHDALSEDDGALLQRSRAAYGRAARGYREYLTHHANDPDAYELSYNLAEALYFSERFEEAAHAYGEVRDSNLDDRFREPAAFRAVKALEALRDGLARNGDLQIPEQADEPRGEPPTVPQQPIPEVIQSLNAARAAYARLFPGTTRAAVFRYHAAQAHYVHGHWDEARTGYADLYADRCNSSPLAYEAWNSLVHMAATLGRLDEAERLARTQRERRCAMAGERGVDDSTREADDIVASALFRRAFERFLEARRTENRELYTQSAQELLDAVDGAEDHPQAARALHNTGLAYAALERLDAARGVWRRVIDDYPHSDVVDAAHYQLGLSSARLFEYDEAVTHYAIVARSSKNRELRRESVLRAAQTLTNLQRYDEAESYWARYGRRGMASDDASRAEAAYLAAEMSARRRDWNAVSGKMRGYLASDAARLPQSGPYRVKAAHFLARAFEKQGRSRQHRQALEEVLAQYGASGAGAGSATAEYAAEARFRIVDRGMAPLESLKIGGSTKAIKQQIEAGARRVGELEAAYKTVSAYRRPQWSVAARCRIGYAYELLARAMLDAVPPTDLEQVILRALPPQARRALKSLPPRDRRELLAKQVAQLEEQWRDDMNKRVRGIENRAVAEYELCIRAAREGNIVTTYTDLAQERLFAYRPEQYPLRRRGSTVLELDTLSPGEPAPTDNAPSPYRRPSP